MRVLMGGLGREHEATSISLCSLRVGGRQFGMETRRIREVLGEQMLQRVPLAPAYIAGVLPYRGEILTALSLRALLGLERGTGPRCLIVLGGQGREGEEEEGFGLEVDSVGGVVTLERTSFAANPSTLDEASRALFDGSCATGDGLLVRLDPERLSPARLAASGLFEEAVRPREGWRKVT